MCCGPTSPRFAHCFACRTVARRLNLPLTPVIPVQLCPVTGPLYAALMGYKESSIDEVRRQFAGRVRDLFSRFLAVHRACLVAAIGGGVDVVLAVPSTSRPGGASLEGVDGLPELVLSGLGGQACWVPAALQRASGAIGHMHPNRHAFAVPRSARRVIGTSRVLLLDDTYVSGSRAQSAAAALRLSGAQSVVVVPAGRVLRPERFVTHAAFIAAQPVSEGHRSRCVVGQAGAGRR